MISVVRKITAMVQKVSFLRDSEKSFCIVLFVLASVHYSIHRYTRYYWSGGLGLGRGNEKNKIKTKTTTLLFHNEKYPRTDHNNGVWITSFKIDIYEYYDSVFWIHNCTPMCARWMHFWSVIFPKPPFLISTPSRSDVFFFFELV